MPSTGKEQEKLPVVDIKISTIQNSSVIFEGETKEGGEKEGHSCPSHQ